MKTNDEEVGNSITVIFIQQSFFSQIRSAGIDKSLVRNTRSAGIWRPETRFSQLLRIFVQPWIRAQRFQVSALP